MSVSDDEDDFLSADEDGFGDEDKQTALARKEFIPDLKRVKQTGKHLGESSCITKGLNDEKVMHRVESRSKPIDIVQKKQVTERNVDVDDEEEKSFQDLSEANLDKETTSKVGDDDEEAILERVRERNLQIARKFSAELAKNVKASTPIPVKRANLTDFKIDDIEYPNNLDSESIPNPPPPTPALSSSFNSDELSASSATQYGWRVPSMQRARHSGNSTPEIAKSEQTSLLLDKLSEKFSQPDKNLFEKIVDDIKKVSIKSEGPLISGGQSSVGASRGAGIPLISEIGQCFSGWNWSGASSKILASASQVTSQVGSVLDSVVNVSQQPTQQPGVVQLSVNSSQAEKSVKNNPNQGDESEQISLGKSTMNASEAASNDVLVDFTLNAMESLGKKAFSVMTYCDESGSLQIKGLGRPWENLLNLSSRERERLHREDSSPAAEPEQLVESSPASDDNNAEHVTLKNRKKRFNKEDC